MINANRCIPVYARPVSKQLGLTDTTGEAVTRFARVLFDNAANRTHDSSGTAHPFVASWHAVKITVTVLYLPLPQDNLMFGVICR